MFSGTWFEFTPHEVGIPGLGAYVDSKYFGSIFQNGQLIREKREKNICYLQGTSYLISFALGTKEHFLYLHST